MNDYKLNGINDDYDGNSRLNEGSVLRFEDELYVGLGGETVIRGRGVREIGRALNLARKNDVISLSQQAKLYRQVREFVLSEQISSADLEGLSLDVQRLFIEGIRGNGTLGSK
jgi:hypothetical protein